MSEYDDIIQEQNLLQGQQDDMLFQQQYQQDLSDPLFQQSHDDMLFGPPRDDGASLQQYQQDLNDPLFQQQQDDAQYQQQQHDDALYQEQQDEVLDVFRELQERYDQEQSEPPVEYQPGAEDLDEPGRIPELDPGYDPYWEPEGAHRFPAESKGEWVEGGKGDGYWQPYDPGAFGLEPGESIPFREGVPDFTDYAFPTPSGEPGVFDVFGLTGDGADYSAAVEQLAAQEGMSFRECQEWLGENKLRLHHYGGDEIQIVPERLHGALGHQGSATEMRE